MSNFKCDKCGTTLIDCGLGVFKTPREIELKERLKILDEEYKKLKRKLEIAEEYLDVIFRGYHFTNDIESYLRSLAEEALQKMKEVSNE